MYRDKLTITLKCAKHPRFNPAKDGPGSVKGGCVVCLDMCSVYRTVEHLKRITLTSEELEKRIRATEKQSKAAGKSN